MSDSILPFIIGWAFAMLIALAVLFYFLRCMGRIATALEMLVDSSVEIGKSVSSTKKSGVIKASCPRCNREINITSCAPGSLVTCPACKCEIEV